jgi:hypothetical protein
MKTISDATDFFDEFYRSYFECKETKAIHKMADRINSRKYTELMMKFLENMGKKSGFNVKMNEPKIDMVWETEKMKIVIEHENYDSVEHLLTQEVENLLSFSSDLKVLITYFKFKELDKKIKQLAEGIKKRLEKVGEHNFEFLVIVTTYQLAKKPEDQTFIGILFRPSLVQEYLF